MLPGQKLLTAESSVQSAGVYTIILTASGGKAVTHC